MNIKDQNNNFQGSKLKTARIFRGFTLEDLEEKLGISHQSISNYENDKAHPDLEMLKKIANILEFTPSFFYATDTEILKPETSHFFRSGAAVAVKYKNRVKEKIKIIAYIIDFIQSKMKLPYFTYPNFIKRYSEFRQYDLEEIDEIATQLRRYIGLGDGPINNITALCERLGIIISFAEMEDEKIDACTVFYKGRPYIILNQEKISSVRLRFNIAHELGHILLHSNYNEKDVKDKSKHKRIEQEANRFASAFLMPESTIVPELASAGLDYLLLLKEHWKVSVQAIIYRAEELGIYTPDYALYLRQQISRKKWRLREPLDDTIPIEKPLLLKQAFRLLVEKNNLSVEEISFKTGLTISELSQLSDRELQISEEYSLTEDNKNNLVYLNSKTRKYS